MLYKILGIWGVNSELPRPKSQVPRSCRDLIAPHFLRNALMGDFGDEIASEPELQSVLQVHHTQIFPLPLILTIQPSSLHKLLIVSFFGEAFRERPTP